MMTKNQYLHMKRAARREAELGGAGFCRRGDYIVLYSSFGGYAAYKANDFADSYKYVRACRRLAQLTPGTTAEQLTSCKIFLEEYK